MSIRNVALFLCCFFVIVFSSFKKNEDCAPISGPQLRTILTQLGYDVKDLNLNPGKEKYVVTITSGGLDVPIAAELSPSTKYIWLTVNLSTADSTNGAKNYSLLKQNGIAQPAQFYVTTKGGLMMGLPVENKAVSNYVLREKLEFLAVKVSSAKSIWQ